MQYRCALKGRKIHTGQEVSRLEDEAMTNAELTALLEVLAKLVEATAKDPADAARIIREAIPGK